jgi:hypothetical protein
MIRKYVDPGRMVLQCMLGLGLRDFRLGGREGLEHEQGGSEFAHGLAKRSQEGADELMPTPDSWRRDADKQSLGVPEVRPLREGRVVREREDPSMRRDALGYLTGDRQAWQNWLDSRPENKIDLKGVWREAYRRMDGHCAPLQSLDPVFPQERKPSVEMVITCQMCGHRITIPIAK